MRKAPFLLLMLLAGTPAFAQAAPRTLNARYTPSFWASASPIQYAAEAHFETQGMAFFWKSIVNATANGGVNAHGVSA
jgi:ABC-type nitrate/sulfonate/bicarbonate transport system substrate-binding protein